MERSAGRSVYRGIVDIVGSSRRSLSIIDATFFPVRKHSRSSASATSRRVSAACRLPARLITIRPSEPLPGRPKMIAAELHPGLSAPLLKLEQQILQRHQPIEHWLRVAMAGARHAVLCIGGSAQQRLQAGAGRYQPVPGRVQQPEARVPAAVRAGRHGRGAEAVPGRQGRAARSPRITRATPFYLQNVVQLQSILRMAGMKVRVGTLHPGDHRTRPRLDLPDGGKLMLEPLVRRGNRIGLQDFDPCVVLLNNDLSAGIPTILENLEQQVIPAAVRGLVHAAQVAATSPPIAKCRRRVRRA